MSRRGRGSGGVFGVLVVEVGVRCDASCGEVRGNAIASVFPSGRFRLAVGFADAQTIQFLMQLPAVVQLTPTRRRRPRLKRVLVALPFPRFDRHPRQRSAFLVVRNIRLPRIREQRQHSGDSLRAGSLACGYGDEQFHEIVVHSPASTLDDVDIFLADRIAYLDAGLAYAEFGEVDLAWWYAEMGADRVSELWVG